MWKIYYQVSIVKRVAIIGTWNNPVKGFGFPTGLIGGDDPTQNDALNTIATITSMSKAVSIGLSWNRLFQSAGVDTKFQIWARALDLNATPIVGMVADHVPVPSNPIMPIDPSGQVASIQDMCLGDTPDPGWQAALGRANTAREDVSIATHLDLPEDVLTP